jgi:2,3-bisphosphoglycerate-dependent phosphoglycerate mutase
MYKVVLLRHGESVWNSQNRFTGWTDVELSPLGIEEAKKAGETLKNEGYVFDLAITSVLKRAIDTQTIVLEILGLQNIEKKYVWQLNERHYGALQGLNKNQMAEKYGVEQVYVWRRSYSVRPPELLSTAFQRQAALEIFKGVPRDKLPKTESLSDTYDRAVSYWDSDIAPAVKAGKKILISAHGNSLRAILKYLDGISDEEISNLNIPTGIPLVYEFDEDMKPVRHYYLGDSGAIARQIEKVKNQGNAK